MKCTLSHTFTCRGDTSRGPHTLRTYGSVVWLIDWRCGGMHSQQWSSQSHFTEPDILKCFMQWRRERKIQLSNILRAQSPAERMMWKYFEQTAWFSFMASSLELLIDLCVPPSPKTLPKFPLIDSHHIPPCACQAAGLIKSTGRTQGIIQCCRSVRICS